MSDQGERTADGIAADFASIPFEGHEARKLAFAYFEQAKRLAVAIDALRAYAEVYPCPGLVVDAGLTSGCDGSGGDCPTCAALGVVTTTGEENGND